MAEVKKAEKTSLVEEVFEEKAELVKQGKSPKLSLTKKTKVEFTKDHGFMKKGDTQYISDIAVAVYEKAKCIKKID